MQPHAPYYAMTPGVPPQEQAVCVPAGATQEPLKQQQPSQPTGMPPLQMPSTMGMMNGSQIPIHSGKTQVPPSFGPATLFNHFSSIFDSSQMGNNQVWGACHLPTRTQPEQPYSAPQAYMGPMENAIPTLDSSKAPGYRPQRVVPSPIGKIPVNAVMVVN